MNLKTRWLPAALSLAALAVPAHADKQAVVKKQLEGVYASYRAAVQRHDPLAALQLFATDITISYPNGVTMESNEVAKALRAWMKETSSVTRWKMELGDVKLKNDKAVVKVNENFVRTINTPGGAVERQAEQSVLEDHWVKTPKGWKLEWIQQLEYRVLQDTRMLKAILADHYDRFVRAMQDRDPDSVVLLWTQDYTEEYPNHKIVNRVNAEKELRKQMASNQHLISWKAHVNDVTQDGDRVIVKLDQTVTMGWRDALGQQHSEVVKESDRDIWVKVMDGWRWNYSQVLKGRITRDGHTFDPYKKR